MGSYRFNWHTWLCIKRLTWAWTFLCQWWGSTSAMYEPFTCTREMNYRMVGFTAYQLLYYFMPKSAIFLAIIKLTIIIVMIISTWGLGNNRTSGDHPNYCIFEIGQNTEKSPGDLRRIVVPQTPVWHTQTPMGLWHTNGSPNLNQKTKVYSNQQK